jgi:hypothetical protein
MVGSAVTPGGGGYEGAFSGGGHGLGDSRGGDRSGKAPVQVPLSKLMLGGELKQHSRCQVVSSDEVLSIIPVSGETL